jgi:hypothetical protein
LVELFGIEVRQIFVDGHSLAEVLAAAHPDLDLATLVPSWLGWSDGVPSLDHVESKYVRDRSALGSERQVAPILLCPDDFDFSCTVVVVDVSASQETVTWHRFGIDRTVYSVDNPEPKYIGGPVSWLPQAVEFQFARAEYAACMQSFAADWAPRSPSIPPSPDTRSNR